MDQTDTAVAALHAAARRVEDAWRERWHADKQPAGTYALHFRADHRGFADALVHVGVRVRRIPSARFGGGEPCEIVVECSFPELQEAKEALKSCSVTDTRCQLVADAGTEGRR